MWIEYTEDTPADSSSLSSVVGSAAAALGVAGESKAIYFQPGKLGPWGITVAEHVEGSNQITQNPVEQGAPIADHIQTDPDFYSCTVFVSNHPMKAPEGESGVVKSVALPNSAAYQAPFAPTPGGLTREATALISNAVSVLSGGKGELKANVLKFDKPMAVLLNVFEKLETLRTSGTLCQVHATLRDYKNMAIERVTAPIDADSGDGCEMTIDFRQIRTATSAEVEAPAPAEIRGASKRALGGKNTKEVNKPELKSLALQGLQKVGVLN